MKIFPLQNNVNFRGATININAFSDTHGNLELADRGLQTLMKNKEDVFEKEEKGKENFLIVGGDWFISGGKTGYLTDPNKPLMKFQGEMLNKFIGKVKEKYPMTKSIFVPGNHETDGGIEIFSQAMRNIDADVIISNLDFKNSYLMQDAIDEGRVIGEKITVVQDDKDPNKKYPVLNLGVMPTNLEFYLNDHDGLELVENCRVPQKYVSSNQTQKTRELIKKRIEEFKSENPNGIVVLTCHTGVNLADEIARETDVDLAFDAHEHKDEIRYVNGTPIVALSQNFQKMVNAKIIVDDDGKKEIRIKELRPNEGSIQQGDLGKFYKTLFEKDVTPIYSITSDDLTSLSTDNIRNRNSHLANFVLDSIRDEIKEYDPDVQIFALNASAIRGGFKISKDSPKTSPIEIANCLVGINHKVANVVVNDVSGKELSYMVLDNFLFNRLDTEKNPLMHYSGLKIDKTGLMAAYDRGIVGDELCQYITLTDTNEQIDPNKQYRIANVEKYFIKATNEKIKEFYSSSKPLNINIHDLFKDHFKKHPNIHYTPDTRLY